MKLGFVATNLNETKSGIGVYTANLLKKYSEHQDLDDIYPIQYSKTKETWGFKNTLEIGSDSSIKNKLFGTYQELKKLNPDLIHFPVYRINDLAAIKLLKNSMKIITVHDIIPLIKGYEEQFLWSNTIKHALNASDFIISDSISTKNDLINIGIPDDKVKVIHLAANEDIVYNPQIKNTKYLDYPYILTTGTLIPRKNYGLLIEAFSHLKRTNNIKHKLIIAGQEFGDYHWFLKRLISDLNLQNDVIIKGYTSQNELNILYNQADLFVYPSLYEGFGIPVLEAMKCGLPVISSNTSSLPEVVGDAGLYFNPNSTVDLVHAMETMIKDESVKEEYSKKSLIRSMEFSWEKTSIQTRQTYRRVLHG